MNLIRTLFVRLFKSRDPETPLIEGRMADQYGCPFLRERIAQAYRLKFDQPDTPITAPALFDPLNPPAGWSWDPYYEIWLSADQV